ncbi:hypothetical protein FB45DRAFT_230258 [Roridomyces roridus]|uniref:Zn(2)-C6 fungal-type domain-containing protein n=1 Tax=Roridomyces roridus TaxID=1738132 RepID=A0AAD7FCX8_9AGAR|nr:hypothetical protein FB45DRAFT_230258 [Roridomyces roridus]
MPQLSPIRQRRALACTNCRKRKVKCIQPDGASDGPCVRCSQRKLGCEYRTISDDPDAHRAQARRRTLAPRVKAEPEFEDPMAMFGEHSDNGRQESGVQSPVDHWDAPSANWEVFSVPGPTGSPTGLSTAMFTSEALNLQEYALTCRLYESKSQYHGSTLDYK